MLNHALSSVPLLFSSVNLLWQNCLTVKPLLSEQLKNRDNIPGYLLPSFGWFTSNLGKVIQTDCIVWLQCFQFSDPFLCYVSFSLPLFYFKFLEGMRWMGFPGGSVVKNLLAMQETQERQVRSLGPADPLEEDMATHSSVLAWKIPWTEEPGGPQSRALQRVRHDWSGWAQHTCCECVLNITLISI